MTVAMASGIWILLGYILGLGWSWIVLAAMVSVTAFFPIWFFRYSRMLWMVLDLYLNPPVREDFEPRGR